MVRLAARLAPRAQTSVNSGRRYTHRFSLELSQFMIPKTDRQSIKPLPLQAELNEPSVSKLACNLDAPSRVKSHHIETPPAHLKWFKQSGRKRDVSELKTDLFKEEGGSSLVPLEYLGIDPESETPTFKRFKAPLSTFASFVEAPSKKFNLYLAQCHFDSFPKSLQKDLDFFPRFLRKYSSERNIYGRNIWIGTPPTYTPLHRDPNHNYFQQLAGTKIVRLMSPEMGLKVYSKLAGDKSNDWASDADPRGRIRSDEMMASSQRQDLYGAVWENQDPEIEIYEGALDGGQSLFIPAGWWHSFKSEDTRSISASINYWFQFEKRNVGALRDLSMRRHEASRILSSITKIPDSSLRSQFLALSKIEQATGVPPNEILGDYYQQVMDAEFHYRQALVKWGYHEHREADFFKRNASSHNLDPNHWKRKHR